MDAGELSAMIKLERSSFEHDNEHTDPEEQLDSEQEIVSEEQFNLPAIPSDSEKQKDIIDEGENSDAGVSFSEESTKWSQGKEDEDEQLPDDGKSVNFFNNEVIKETLDVNIDTKHSISLQAKLK